MRVISGTAKGRMLRSAPGTGTRPITDRVKEAIFNIIGADVVSSLWWDVFGGTGAVGIEALSRGAAHARFTELHRGPLETIQANLSLTNLADRAELRRADAFTLLSAQPDQQFDYIYLAPPQYQDMWWRALAALDGNLHWLSPDGWVLVQVAPKEYRAWSAGKLEEFDTRKYGTTLVLFYARKEH
jgi:16S rRNA (guanine(966)-N(2))-methyltransferase RsmD